MVRRDLLAVVSVLPLWAIAACTYDFDAFETGSGGADSGGAPQEAGATDVNVPPPDSAAAPDTSVPPDASVAPDASTGCDEKASCVSTAMTCRGSCDATFTTCANQCGGGQPGQACRDKCAAERMACREGCSATCRSCAGPACEASCP